MNDDTISSFSLSVSGLENKDAIAQVHFPNGKLLLAIADGVSSASHGGDAARLAIKTCLNFGDKLNISDLFFEVNNQINNSVNMYGGQWSSTLSVCLIQNQHALIGHVGDTRIYHLRKHGLITRTHDHTEIARLIAEGIISSKRAVHYPRRHVLLSAMDGNGKFELQQINFELFKGDRILLVSDGFYSQINKREIITLSNKYSHITDFVEALKNLLLQRGLVDDASVLCAQI